MTCYDMRISDGVSDLCSSARREQVMDVLYGADMVFITPGMGGRTGTGAPPVVAQLGKEMGILTVAVVTKPFPFEGRRRMQVALKGIDELGQHCDSLITIPNEKLITEIGRASWRERVCQ